MFKKDQPVWCVIYGAGVVENVRQEGGVPYPIYVKFKEDLVVIYTSDGKFHEQGNVTLFPHPVEVVKALTKPSIDWSHASEEFQYLVQDEDGRHWLTTAQPEILPTGVVCGRGRALSADHFASLVPGTCDSKDSLVKRPD